MAPGQTPNRPPLNRRPLRSRDSRWARSAATWLAARGVHPDAVSAAAVGFAALGATAFVGGGVMHGGARAALLMLAALAIQGRLACNLLDGLVAVEHGRGGPLGPIWNELPDRAADTLLLVACGYGAALSGDGAGAALGWLAAVLAVTTAYVRELGRALGFPADFTGPGAKPHRMALLTATTVVGAVDSMTAGGAHALLIGLATIATLTAVTVARRTATLASRLRHSTDPGA